MRMVRWWTGPIVASCLLALTVGGAARGAEDKANKDVDTAVFKALKDVINRGADLYNGGDHNGCYRLYEGGLITARSMLGHRPKLQGEISSGLAAAERNPVVRDRNGRAFALRALLDRVREETNPNPTKSTPVAKPGPKPKPMPKPVAKKTLWDRLGGEKGVAKIVDDLVAKASKDPKVDLTRGGKYPLTGEAGKHFKKEAVNWISAHSGGPFKYDDKSMKEAHKNMGITAAQFDAFKEDLRDVLEDHLVGRMDVEKIMSLVESYRSKIVAPKKPPQPKETKPVTTKPAETKKPKTTKPADTKPATTKPADTKPVKPPTTKKPADTKE